MNEGEHTEVRYVFEPEPLPEPPVLPFPEVSTVEEEVLPAEGDQEVLAGCCDHTSASSSTRRRFKAALKRLGIPVGVMHDSCFGLMNHLDSGEEYRWQDGKVEQFDRDAYVWNTVEVK